MFKSNFTGTKRTIALFILSIACMLVCVSQIIAGCRMINENNAAPTISTKKDYDRLKAGDIINGYIDELLFAASDDETDTRLYFAVSESNHILVFRCLKDSEIEKNMEKLAVGKEAEIYYKGTVHPLNNLYSSFVKREITFQQLKKRIDLDMTANEAYLGLVVDMVQPDAQYSEKAINATFVGAILMFVLAVLFLIKPIKNAYESIAAEKGKYKPKLAVTKDDIDFEMQGYYTGEEQQNNGFFVNTEYNIRDYGASKEDDSPADRSQLPTSKDDPAMNRNEKGEPLFYTGEVNEEGNFYVSSQHEATTEFGKETLNKRY